MEWGMGKELVLTLHPPRPLLATITLSAWDQNCDFSSLTFLNIIIKTK